MVIEDVLVCLNPVEPERPVVYDSPHSGTRYPADFKVRCPHILLRQMEDTHVEALFAQAPAQGALLLHALVPRSYIDLNRAEDDIDPASLDGPWGAPLHPTEKCRYGMGLIRTTSHPGEPLYNGRLSVSGIRRRIETYWRPYHQHLSAALDRLHGRFGAVWHINCHSMPSLGLGHAGADFVVGDRDGQSCDPGFSRFIMQTLRDLGYRVRHNDPYKGVELVRRYANPRAGRHSLQLEIDRRLYMDEQSLVRHDGFWRLKADLERLMAAVNLYVGQQLERRAAE